MNDSKGLVRNWLPLVTVSETEAKGSDLIGSFTIASYNILAQHLIRRSIFGYCSKNALKWPTRRENLKRDVKELDADILCLQECDYYDEFFKPELEKIGYDSVFKKKPGNNKFDGCAIFYKRDKFSLVKYKEIEFDGLVPQGVTSGPIYEELRRGNVGQIAALRYIAGMNNNNTSGESEHANVGVTVGNTHLFWNPLYTFVRLKQLHKLLSDMTQFIEDVHYPVVLCGDFNATPDGITYKMITNPEGFDLSHTTDSILDQIFAQDDVIQTPSTQPPTTTEVEELSIDTIDSTTPTTDNDDDDDDDDDSNSSATTAVDTTAPLTPAQKIIKMKIANPMSLVSFILPPEHADPLVSHVSSYNGSIQRLAIHMEQTREELAQRIDEARALIQDLTARLPRLESVYRNYTDITPSPPPHRLWKGEPQYTTFGEGFKACLDYILTMRDTDCVKNKASARIVPTKILSIPEPDVLSTQVALPNDNIASDHLPIACHFSIYKSLSQQQ